MDERVGFSFAGEEQAAVLTAALPATSRPPAGLTAVVAYRLHKRWDITSTRHWGWSQLLPARMTTQRLIMLVREFVSNSTVIQ